MAEGFKVLFTKLNGENYFTWKYKMELFLRKEKVWTAISTRRPIVHEESSTVTAAIIQQQQEKLDAFLEKDEMARVTIGLFVEDNQLALIRNLTTAKETWDTLKSYYERNTFQNKVMIMRRIWELKLTDESDMEQHIREMTDSFQKLVDMGEQQVNENWKIAIFLSSLPSSYDTLVQTLEARPEADLTLSLVHSKCIGEFLKRKNMNCDNTSATVLKTSTRGCYFCKEESHFKRDCTKYKEWLKKNPRKEYGTESNKEKVNKIEHKEEFLFQLSTTAIKFDDEWIIDSGATTHITNNKRLFDSFDSSQSSQVVVANDTKEYAKGKGTCTIDLISNNGNTSTAKLQDVLYAPNIHGNMISVHKLLNNGYSVNFGNGVCEILRDGKQIAVADDVNGLYRLRRTHKVNNCLENEHKKECLHFWHRVFGHRDPEAIKTMNKGNLIKGMKLIDCGIKMQCETCMEAKSTRLPFPKKSQSSSKAILDLIHTDVCGPMQTESIGKKRYILTMIDDYSKYTEVYFMHNKSDTEDRIKEYISMVQNKFNCKPKVIRSDRGGEFMSNELMKFMRENGIKTQYTAPYSPQQNGVAERKNRSLVEMARCMLTDAKLPMYLWAEAINTANFIQNRTITKGANNIPHELWNGEMPNAMNFQIFGTKCYAHIPTEKRKKFDNTAVQMRFIGYEPGSKAYRLYDPVNGKLLVSRDVRFLRNETHSNNVFG